MMKIVGIGEYAISNSKEDVIKTFSLGSCVALTIYCKKTNTCGMVHIVLPSPSNVEESLVRPTHYATSAIPFMLEKFKMQGCNSNNVEIGIFGGANSSRQDDAFRIGQRNVATIKKILNDNGFYINKEDTGGYCSRTIELSVNDGEIKIHSHPMII